MNGLLEKLLNGFVEGFTVWFLFIVFLALRPRFNTATELIWTASAFDMTANVMFSFSWLTLIALVVLSMRMAVLKA